ncbi:MAG TPA: amidohydrolase [Patescibacteria group bacterium]|nr:amidohydrolase [Patescibacteria group bacterium]
MLKEKIHQLSTAMNQELIDCRRDFHRYAETAWTEFRTASLVANNLSRLGYQVLTGDAVVKTGAMMGVPSPEELAVHLERARNQGAIISYLDAMKHGQTGVVAILNTGRPGPVVALRFDLDANDVNESTVSVHRPVAEGFASINSGAMHACGHDGHTAIGLGVGQVLIQLQDQLNGTVKLIFQPAEEGVRGARAMTESGIVDDVDYMLGMHIGFLGKRTGQLVCGGEGFLATTKLDATFVGTPAHAGAAPQKGKNALLAAATAAVSLHAISRHSDGISRINVGVLQAGTGRNVVPANALLKLETRGVTTAIDGYMREEATRIIQGAAAMYGTDVSINEMGGAVGGKSTPKLAATLKDTAIATGLFDEIIDTGDLGASEDFTYFMERVQQKGGQSVYAMVGANIAAGHHDNRFDFDEAALAKSVELLSLLTANLLQKH